MTKHVLCSDDTKMITDAIAEMKEAGVDLIICTGGMSVDPDDKTPGAIKASGAEIVTYGAPTLPGAMLCLAYFEDDTPIVGLPGCVMYAKATVFDLILPRMAAGIKILSGWDTEDSVLVVKSAIIRSVHSERRRKGGTIPSDT